MRRREFLKTGAVLVAGGAVPRPPAAPGVQEGSRPASKVAERRPGSLLKLSCAAYSFRQFLTGDTPTMTLEQFIDFCADHELEGTELTSYYFRDTSPAYLRSLRRRAIVNGLDISGTPVRNDFCLPSGPSRQKQVEHVKLWLDHAAQLGAQTMRVFAGTTKKEWTDRGQLRAWTVEGLREIADHAAQRGVLLALENHGHLTETAEQVLELVQRTASPWLGVNLDTGNFRAQPYENLEKAAPYAVSCQVKVAVRGPDGSPAPCDFERVVGILRAAGFRGYLALEYEGGEDPRVAVPRFLRMLREAVQN